MSERTRDIAKFVAGFAANETLGHWMLGSFGTHLFPMKIAGISFTQEFNRFAMWMWLVVLLVSFVIGWHRRASLSAMAKPSHPRRRRGTSH